MSRHPLSPWLAIVDNIRNSWSGWRDSNSRPPAPKAGALTKLRYIPVARRSLPSRPGHAPHTDHDARLGRQPRRSPRPPRCARRDLPGPRRRYATRVRSSPLTSSAPPCGRSSMAEPQPSKLVMRVRFPSPAPSTGLVRAVITANEPLLEMVGVPCTCHEEPLGSLQPAPRPKYLYDRS
jgi:hypothetical protein